MVEKDIKDYSVIELKALLFDLDQEVKFKQNQAQQIFALLQEKYKKEKVEFEYPKSESQTMEGKAIGVNKDGINKK